MKYDRHEISGLLVLFIGVGLLAFTFLNAYWLLEADIGLIASQDLVTAFGEAMAPLIVTIIHVMYLGIMGWIGSLLTLRGIHILAQPRTIAASTQPSSVQPMMTQPPSVRATKNEEKAKEEIAKPQPSAEPEAKPVEKPDNEGITIEVKQPEQVAEPSQASTPSPQPQEQPQQ